MCGPFTYAVAKTAVSLKGSRRGFAGAVLTMRTLDGHLDLLRELSDPRIRRSSPYTRRLFVHHFRVRSLDELDDEFGRWIAEAYAVGQGAHLRDKPPPSEQPSDARRTGRAAQNPSADQQPGDRSAYGTAEG